ncbi:hypothetical protein N0V82_008601 [Gnomoniopsis sp. IMI 355080]|nr:hypothetical protein N0V82_008601 [Gnomoniopsis sp. IMI 355080]
MAYRVTLPASRLRGIEGLEDLITRPGNIHWIGPKGTILSYLLEGVNDTLVNLVFTCDVELGTMEDGVDQKSGTPDEVLKAFQDWDPRIATIVQYVDSVLEWRLYTHNSVDRWVHPSGHLCLIGDSAHAMTPYLAQGAAMGIEDAAVLGGVLKAYPDAKDLSTSLSIYEKLRIGRTSMVAAASIDSRWFTQMEDGPEQEQRDEYLLSHPGIWPDHINIRSRKEFLDELFGYDAYEALENELRATESNLRNGREI